MSAQSVIMIVVGAIALIGGYSMFRSMLPMWGFILGGWLFYSFLPVVIRTPQAQTALYQAGAFIIGGILGAVIAMPLYYVIVFLSGGALGAMAGVMVGALVDIGGFSSARALMNFTQMSFPPIPQTNTQILFMVIFGVILGVASLSFQKFMIIASSALLGAALLVSGLGGSLSVLLSSDTSRSAMMMMGWLLIGVVGMIVQFRMMGEV